MEEQKKVARIGSQPIESQSGMSGRPMPHQMSVKVEQIMLKVEDPADNDLMFESTDQAPAVVEVESEPKFVPKVKQQIKLVLLTVHQVGYTLCVWLLPFLFVVNCKEGHNWGGHITIACVLAPFYIFELVVMFRDKSYRRSYEIVVNGLRQVYERKSTLSLNFWHTVTFFFRYIWPMIQTILTSMDYYLDVCFLSIVWTTEERTLSLVATITLVISSLPKLYGLVSLVINAIRMTYYSEDMHRIFKLLELEVEVCLHPTIDLTNELILKWLNGIWKFASEDCIQCVVQIYYIKSGACGDVTDPAVVYASICFSLLTSGLTMIYGIYKLIWLYLLPKLRLSQLAPEATGKLKIRYNGENERLFFKVDTQLLQSNKIVNKEIQLKCNYLSLYGMIDLIKAYGAYSRANSDVLVTLKLDLYTGSNTFLRAVQENPKVVKADTYDCILRWRLLRDYYMRKAH
jgi:hypothetical protein